MLARIRHFLQEFTRLPPESELCIYRHDKAVLALVKLNAKLGWGDGGCLLLVGVLLIGAQALATLGSGDLLSERLWSDGFLKDLNTYLPFELVSRSYETLTD